MSAKKSYAKAVTQHCKDCIYDPKDKGTWRQQVESCFDRSCALYDLRPLPLPSKAKIEADLIAVS